MRTFDAHKRRAVIGTFAIAVTALVTAGASAATLMTGAVHVNLGSSFADLPTWALLLASFAVIGLGIRSRKRSVVLS
jgi:hypothetical protein